MSQAELQNLEDLFEHLLQDMYYAEHKITKTLPKMADKATDTELQDGFKQHLKETKDQIEKIEKVFEITGLKKKREKCEAIEGLIKEGEHLIEISAKGPVLDAALIAAAQKVEHYEIASYGALCHIADLMGNNEAKDLIGEILSQEKNTDKKLSSMSTHIEKDAMDKAA
jgi:ferritin-like metal-binding protein YciE